jgi:hypothetical protein
LLCIIASLATSQNWKSKPWDSPPVWKIVDPQKVFECWKYKSTNAFLFVLFFVCSQWFSSCSLEVPQVPELFLKTFPIAPQIYPIWFAQSSTLMYINWKCKSQGGVHMFLFCNWDPKRCYYWAEPQCSKKLMIWANQHNSFEK